MLVPTAPTYPDLPPQMCHDNSVATQLTCLAKLFLIPTSSLTQFTLQLPKEMHQHNGKDSRKARIRGRTNTARKDCQTAALLLPWQQRAPPATKPPITSYLSVLTQAPIYQYHSRDQLGLRVLKNLLKEAFNRSCWRAIPLTLSIGQNQGRCSQTEVSGQNLA